MLERLGTQVTIELVRLVAVVTSVMDRTEQWPEPVRARRNNWRSAPA